MRDMQKCTDLIVGKTLLNSGSGPGKLLQSLHFTDDGVETGRGFSFCPQWKAVNQIQITQILRL